jgi:hypothetical protein
MPGGGRGLHGGGQRFLAPSGELISVHLKLSSDGQEDPVMSRRVG